MSDDDADPSSARIYTRTGDAGETGLLGGTRVPKDHPRVELLGTLDELSAHLSVARSFARNDWLRDRLIELQDLLYVASGELACADAAAHDALQRTVRDEDVTRLETIIDDARGRVQVAPSFLYPARRVAVALNVARTVARRGERRLVTLARDEPVFGKHVLPAINRVSDVLFALTCLAEAAGEPQKE